MRGKQKNPKANDRAPTVQRRTTNEAAEQEMLFNWAAWAEGQAPELSLLFHVPNGGKRNAAEAAHLKRQGVRAGVPDLCLPVARGGYHGLFIELKAEGGRPSAAQKEWLGRLRVQGYKAEICVGWTAAAAVICDYLGIRPPDILR